MFKIFVGVTIAGILIAQFILFCFTGIVAFAPWVYEVMLSYFWFMVLLDKLNKTYCDVTKPESDLWKFQPMIRWVFFVNIVFSFSLRFMILPLFTESMSLTITIAYIGSLFVTVVLPMEIAKIAYPLWEKRQESEKFSPDKIKKIALQSAAAKQFSKLFPQYKTYVFDSSVRNSIATSLFLHRHERGEQTDMLEDITLEVPVDLKRKIPVTDNEKLSRYVFQTTGETSSVLQLPEFSLSSIDVLDKPLDDFTLGQFDTLVDRFPSLQDIPFSLALRNVPYKVIESEVSTYRRSNST